MIRRDVQPNNEQIPLLIEMVYNSFSDAITNIDKTYFRDDPAHFNRIYFKYPPEWKTSNIGEKIIGIRNMKISIRQRMKLDFTLYIRKYKQKAFNDLANVMFPGIVLNEDEIQDVVDRMNDKDIHVYKIDYTADIFDNIDEFINDLNELIDENNIYNYIYDEILKTDDEPDDKIGALEQLDTDKENYAIMCLRNNIPFYLNNNAVGISEVCDVDIVEVIHDKNIELKFFSHQNEESQYYVDFLMTPRNKDVTYKKFYDWDDDKDEPLHNQVLWPGILDPAGEDKFKFDTACYFNIGTTNPNRNSLEYVTKFHRELRFFNVMTNLQCEVAASFASQSNHNLIGRTNEMYEPIKYYKINDNDDKFWVEFYDRNEINVPIAFNDFVMFTMDVVFLQNRKLLYS
ncbi:hypothetical protein M9Y10_045025 [Tritrichomonas musculus]|uniref:Uncharacterized protein n=1 Tax=Tritrichomonas musculus TaxID=1915356 RepID=A0ABR2JUA9_9EUKA